MKMDELNRLARADFVIRLGSVYEHSPWVAEAVADQRPFGSRDELTAAMRAKVDAADEAGRLRLIRAHPDLAGKFALAGELTVASRSEQSGAGLDRLEAAELALFQELNARYRETFGFPFIICVRLTDKAGILEAFRRRLESDPGTEQLTALNEIHHIARLRIADLIAA